MTGTGVPAGSGGVIGPTAEVSLPPVRFREVFDSSLIGIVISEPRGRIVQTNASLDELVGCAAGELIGTDLDELFAPTELPAIQEHYQRMQSGQELQARMRSQLRRKDGGEPLWVYLAISTLLDAAQQPEYLATMVVDVTELYLLKEWLSRQVLYDPQTGLPNRQYFVSHLKRVLARLEPSAVITLLHLDLDGFSAVNDGLGDHFGDRMLKTVAKRLRMVVADQRAMVARLGGDEFAILIEPGRSAPEVGSLAETINTELEEPIYLDEIGLAVTATIGIVQQRIGRTEHTELLRAAGSTLRQLRGRGKRQWAVFDADADVICRVNQQLAAMMPGALETGQLRVEYQPVVTLEERRPVGVEAVLNWPHPQLGVRSHEQCIRIAGQTGVIHAAEQWLLHSAATQAVAWQERFGPCTPPVMVNLSSCLAQDPDLVAKIRTVLRQTGLPAHSLEVRMPVTAIRTDIGVLAEGGGAEAEDNLKVLAELGVRLGLYDFGGGIGGLRCLAEMPVRTVRIAEPIARQVADDPSRLLSQAVHALVHIVRAAGIDVIAHPVESTEQAGCWQWVGANWGVGTVFGRPGPPETLDPLLDSPETR